MNWIFVILGGSWQNFSRDDPCSWEVGLLNLMCLCESGGEEEMNCFGCCRKPMFDENQTSLKRSKQRKEGASFATLVNNISFKSGTLPFIMHSWKIFLGWICFLLIEFLEILGNAFQWMGANLKKQRRGRSQMDIEKSPLWQGKWLCNARPANSHSRKVRVLSF